LTDALEYPTSQQQGEALINAGGFLQAAHNGTHVHQVSGLSSVGGFSIWSVETVRSVMFSEMVSRRLDDEVVIWMTTVAAGGKPQTSVVWYWWDGSEFLIYSLDPAARLRNLADNPHVSLNLDGNARGGDVVTIEGVASFDPAAPTAAEMEDYVAKYRHRMDRGWGGPEGFAEKYPTAIRVRPTRVRSW
jgi:PPOX class probable F420-dependent enzyme